MKHCKITRPAANYSVVSNLIARDPEISLAAVGVYFKVMSLPETWDFTLAGLVAICKEGKRAVGRALKELREAGYCSKVLTRNGNRISGVEWRFYHEPIASQAAENQDTNFEDAHFEDAHFEDAQNRDLINKVVNKRLNFNKLNKRESHAHARGKKIEFGLGGSPLAPPNDKKRKNPPVAPPPPSLEQAVAYLSELGHPSEAVRFYNYYQARGWAGIADWRALAASWISKVPLFAAKEAAKKPGLRAEPKYDYTNAEQFAPSWRDSPEHLAAKEKIRIMDEQLKNGTYAPEW